MDSIELDDDLKWKVYQINEMIDDIVEENISLKYLSLFRDHNK